MKSTTQNVKETIESIVVAFILAFVFRAFILEAYVIPTGSMAVTLYGDQLTNTCSCCGYEYARGASEEEARYLAQSRDRVVQLRCPNCDTMVDRFDAAQMLQRDSGDRIVVLKWAWALGDPARRLGLGPQRWDVTVFKDPRDGTTNFIKRLVGLPGEVLEIIDGDIYTVPVAELAVREPGLIEAMEQLRRDVYAWGQTGHVTGMPDEIRARYEQINRRLLPHLRIQRKTEVSQKSLWINVFDNDFHPASHTGGRTMSQVGWSPIDALSAACWDTAGREFRFAAQGPMPATIRFVGKDITDFSAYNFGGIGSRVPHGDFLCGELKLSFILGLDRRSSPAGTDAGALILQMNRDRDVFAAEIRGDGVVSLERRSPAVRGGKLVIGQVALDRSLLARPTLAVEMSNVDYQVSLRVEGQTVLATNDSQYAPDLERALTLSQASGPQPQASEVTVSVRGLSGYLRHIRLARDVYYRSTAQQEDALRDATGRPIRPNPYHRWPGWGTAGYPILLRPEQEIDGRRFPGEYYMLGDNSAASKDSRLWWEIGPHLQNRGEDYQLGTVPGDQLIGMAFFVYWPAGYRPLGGGSIGLIPNFGRMRWIR